MDLHEHANRKLFMWLILLFMSSLFILSIPYITLLVLFFGSFLFGIKFVKTMQIDKHAAAFAALLLYLFGWGLLTGGFAPSSLLTPGFYGGEGRILFAYMPIFLVFAAPQALFHDHNVRLIFKVLAVFSAVALVISIAGKMDLLFGSHHAAGYASGSLLVIFMSLYAEEKKSWQRNGVIAALLMLMLSNSRTTLVGLAIALIIYYRSRLLVPKVIIGVTIFLICGFYLWSIISPFSFDRFMILFDPELWTTIRNQFSLATSVEDPSLESVERIGANFNILTRIILWGRAIWLFEASPIFGIGSFRFNDPGLTLHQLFPGLSVGSSLTQSLSVSTAHNSYFHTLAEGGLVGVIMHLMPWILILRTIKQRPKSTSLDRSMSKMATILILFMMFGALTGHLLASPSMTLWVVFISSITLRSNSNLRTDRKIAVQSRHLVDRVQDESVRL